jgi:hypothetical protein
VAGIEAVSATSAAKAEVNRSKDMRAFGFDAQQKAIIAAGTQAGRALRAGC